MSHGFGNWASGDSDDEAGLEVAAPEPLDPPDALRAALAAGMSERDAVRQVSTDLKLSRRDVYGVMLALKSESEPPPSVL